MPALLFVRGLIRTKPYDLHIPSAIIPRMAVLNNPQIVGRQMEKAAFSPVREGFQRPGCPCGVRGRVRVWNVKSASGNVSAGVLRTRGNGRFGMSVYAVGAGDGHHAAGMKRIPRIRREWDSNPAQYAIQRGAGRRCRFLRCIHTRPAVPADAATDVADEGDPSLRRSVRAGAAFSPKDDILPSARRPSPCSSCSLSANGRQGAYSVPTVPLSFLPCPPRS